MSLSINSSTSGVRAAFTTLNVSAHNVANASTDGFKKQNVNLSEDANSGVTAKISKSTEAGPSFTNDSNEIVEGSNVDLSEEAIAQINASHLLSANMAVIERTAEAQESLFDIFA